jgi:translation initiation factor eIF-2B subunit delta
LKAKKKAEKAARREQAKVIEPSPATTHAPAAGNDKQGGGKQTKPKQDAPGTSAANRSKKPVPTPAPVAAPKQPTGPVVPESFSHLPMARKLPLSKADKDVHPAVLAIGQQMATFTLKDSVARLEATLMAFRKVGNQLLKLICL